MRKPWPSKGCRAVRERNVSCMYHEVLICYISHLQDVGLVDFQFYQIKNGEMPLRTLQNVSEKLE
jgi:hypothetical protein